MLTLLPKAMASHINTPLLSTLGWDWAADRKRRGVSGSSRLTLLLKVKAADDSSTSSVWSSPEPLAVLFWQTWLCSAIVEDWALLRSDREQLVTETLVCEKGALASEGAAACLRLLVDGRAL